MLVETDERFFAKWLEIEDSKQLPAGNLLVKWQTVDQKGISLINIEKRGRSTLWSFPGIRSTWDSTFELDDIIEYQKIND